MNLTYRELLRILSNLNDNQLDTNVTILVSEKDEYFPAVNFAYAKENDILDDTHLFIVI